MLGSYEIKSKGNGRAIQEGLHPRLFFIIEGLRDTVSGMKGGGHPKTMENQERY